MTKKSIVYWAPPIEIAALPNKRENIVKIDGIELKEVSVAKGLFDYDL